MLEAENQYEELKEECGSDDSSYSEQLRYLFNVCCNVFIDHVKVIEIQSRVTCMRCHAGEILAIHKGQGAKKAAEVFLEKLEEIPAEGKYQELLQALKDFGYKIIVNAIEKGEFMTNQDEHKKLIDLLSHNLMMKIDATEMAGKLFSSEVISKIDEESIRKTADPSLAHFKLIDSMPRRDPNWFDKFLDALYSLDQFELCKLLDETWYEKKRGKEHQDDMVGPDHSGLEAEPPQSSQSTERVASTSSSSSQQMFTFTIPHDRQRSESSQQQQLMCHCNCREEFKIVHEQLQDLRQKAETDSVKLDEILKLLKKL